MAYTCNHCQVIIESIDSELNFCPECGQPHVHDEGIGWSPIAKFGELAEAGYFADQLRAEGIRSRIVATTHLEADGTWRSQFQLLTAEPEEVRARQWLVRHIEEHDELGWNDDHEPERLRPTKGRLAGVLIIIGCSLSTGLMLGVQLRPPERSFVEFWNTIKSSPPYSTDPRQPGPTRRMDFDQQRGVIRIQQDLDRDGVFDQQVEFRPAG